MYDFVIYAKYKETFLHKCVWWMLSIILYVSFLKTLLERQRGGRMEIRVPICWFHPQRTAHIEAGPRPNLGARNSIQDSHMSKQRPKFFSQHCYFPGFALAGCWNQEVDLKIKLWLWNLSVLAGVLTARLKIHPSFLFLPDFPMLTVLPVWPVLYSHLYYIPWLYAGIAAINSTENITE